MVALDDIVIRNELLPGDIGYVTYLHGLIYSREFGYGLDFESYVAKGLHDFFENFEAGRDAVWVCEHGSKIVGFLSLMNHGEVAQLRYFIIDPDYRGLGLGQKLMDHYMDFLHKTGYTSTYLLTSSDLGAARHLYQKYGFELVEEIDAESFEKPDVLQKYQLKIDS